MYKTSTFQQVRTYEQFSTSTYCVEAHKYLQIITILKTKKKQKNYLNVQQLHQASK